MRRCIHAAIALTTFASLSPAQQVLVEPLIRSTDLVPGTSIPFGYVFNGASAINGDGSVTAVRQSRVVRASTGGLQTLFSFADPVLPLGMAVTFSGAPTLFSGQAFASTVIRPDGQAALAVGIPPRIAITRGDPTTGDWFATGITDYFSNAQDEAVYVDDQPFRIGYWNPTLGSSPLTLLASPVRPNPNDRQRFEPPTITDLGTIYAPRYDPIDGLNSYSLLAGRPGSMQVVLGGGLPLPGLPSGARISIFPRRNGVGSRLPTVFHAPDYSVAALATCFLPGIAFTPGVLFVGDAGGLTAAVISGNHIPGLNPDVVAFVRGSVDPVFVARGGFVAISCDTRVSSFSGNSNGNAVLAGFGTNIRAILKRGDGVPGIPNATIFTPTALGANALGDVLVNLILAGDVTSDDDQLVAVMTQDMGLVPLLREGQTLDLAPGDTRVVASAPLILPPFPSFNNAMINDQRQIILSLRFTDQSSAIVRFTIPAPASAAIAALLAPAVLIRRRRALFR